MNFKLRPWQMSDVDSLVKHANNFNIARYMTDQFPHPYTEKHGIAFIEFASVANPVNIMAIEVNGEAAGGIGLHLQQDIYRKNAEMGYWLSEDYWGKGIMTAAIIQMKDYGFKKFDIARIFARPFETNPASQKILQKAGFRLEARLEKSIYKNRTFINELIYSFLKDQ